MCPFYLALTKDMDISETRHIEAEKALGDNHSTSWGGDRVAFQCVLPSAREADTVATMETTEQRAREADVAAGELVAIPTAPAR